MKRYTGMCLAILAVLQIVQFCWYYHREIAWNVPINSDQAKYLRESYDLQQVFKEGGIAALPAQLNRLIKDSANGFGISAEGFIFSFFEDGARLSRLHLNLAALLLLELCAFYTISYLTSSQIWGWALLGLILSQNVAWFWAGGMFDFRPDFVAYCLFGIWVCTVLRSEVCLNRKWSIISGIAAFFLVINRYVAMVYVTGIVISLAAILLIWYRRVRSQPEKIGQIRARLINLFISTAVALMLIAPFMVIARQSIHDYYIVGHLTGPEKWIRLHEAGVFTVKDFLLFYFVQPYENDLQKFFFLVCGVMFAFAILIRIAKLWKPSDPAATSDVNQISRSLRMIFLGLSIFVPLGALTADFSKSGVVGSIMCAPFAVIIVYFASKVCGTLQKPAKQYTMAVGAFAVFCLGVGNVISNTSAHTSEYRLRNDMPGLVEAAQWVTWTADERGWHDPHVSFDIISGYLCGGVLCCEAFEHGNRPVGYQTRLGGDIFEVNKGRAIDLLIDSDFVFLTDKPKMGVFPFYQSIKEMEPEIDSWVKAHYAKGREFDFEGNHVTIYVRPITPTP